MVRAAAKNHEHVGIVTSPADYPAVLAELRAAGSLSGATRRPTGPGRLRAHGGLRRGDRRLADAGGPTPVSDLEGASEADAEEAALGVRRRPCT